MDPVVLILRTGQVSQIRYLSSFEVNDPSIMQALFACPVLMFAF